MPAKTKKSAPQETWTVELHDDFVPEFEALDHDVQDSLLAVARAIELAGPKTGRPHVDTLRGSKHQNMKELRFEAHDGNEVWRAAFAFDPQRKGCVLVAGAKQGKNQLAFYRQLIKVADRRFDKHLKALKARKV